MKKIYLCLIFLLFLTSAYAGISISPDSFSTGAYGGESITKTFTVSSDFENRVRVGIGSIASNSSNDLNGFSLSVSPEEFNLDAGESKEVNLTFSFVPNIKPDTYYIKVIAFATEEVVEEIIKEVEKIIYVGGGTRTIYETIYDTNTIYEDKNVFVFVEDNNKLLDWIIKQDKEIGDKNKLITDLRNEIKKLKYIIEKWEESEEEEEREEPEPEIKPVGLSAGLLAAAGGIGLGMLCIIIGIILYIKKLRKRRRAVS